MRVLIACEFSGVVREAFNAYSGIHAVSCDLLPAEDGRTDYHMQCDVLSVLNDGWDAVIAFPPCTFLCNSGVRWLYGGKGTVRDPKRWQSMTEAARFFSALLNAPIPFIAVENPIQHKYARHRIGQRHSQIIQPWQHGHGETKATCLRLKNLPLLTPTNVVSGRIAQAMAAQWVPHMLKG